MAQDELQLESARHNYPAPRLWHRSSLKNSTATPIDPSPLALLSPLPTLALPSRSRVTEKCSKMSNFPENPEEICKHHQPSIIIDCKHHQHQRHGNQVVIASIINPQSSARRLGGASDARSCLRTTLPSCGCSGFPSR